MSADAGGTASTRPMRFRYSGVIDSAIVSPIASWNAAFALFWNRNGCGL